ncbi:MAG: hypothetical protein ACT4QF_11650 [Sporichthyaceae bacterium]
MSVRRIALVAASAVIALPLSIAMAGSASAADSPLGAVDGLGLDAITGTVTGATGNLPIAGDLLGGVTGSASKSAKSSDPVSGLTGNLPIVGGAAGDPLSAVTGLLGEGGVTDIVTGLPIAGPLVDSLGVTEVVDGLLETVTGTVGGVLGGNTGSNTSHKPSKSNHGKSSKPEVVKYEQTSLPHTGGDADMTALLMCAGLAVAGTGVTLVTRRRRAGALAG